MILAFHSSERESLMDIRLSQFRISPDTPGLFTNANILTSRDIAFFRDADGIALACGPGSLRCLAYMWRGRQNANLAVFAIGITLALIRSERRRSEQ
jgi:hypothetical protein